MQSHILSYPPYPLRPYTVTSLFPASAHIHICLLSTLFVLPQLLILLDMSSCASRKPANGSTRADSADTRPPIRHDHVGPRLNDDDQVRPDANGARQHRGEKRRWRASGREPASPRFGRAVSHASKLAWVPVPEPWNEKLMDRARRVKCDEEKPACKRYVQAPRHWG